MVDFGDELLPGRFWEKIKVDGDCWLWDGEIRRGSIPTFYFEGRRLSAHRHMYETCVGELKGAAMRRKCSGGGRCVNPAHFRIEMRGEGHMPNWVRNSERGDYLCKKCGGRGSDPRKACHGCKMISRHGVKCDPGDVLNGWQRVSKGRGYGEWRCLGCGTIKRGPPKNFKKKQCIACKKKQVLDSAGLVEGEVYGQLRVETIKPKGTSVCVAVKCTDCGKSTSVSGNGITDFIKRGRCTDRLCTILEGAPVVGTVVNSRRLIHVDRVASRFKFQCECCSRITTQPATRVAEIGCPCGAGESNLKSLAALVRGRYRDIERRHAARWPLVEPISLAEFRKLTKDAECHWCGSADLGQGYGVDRVDPSAGYVNGNCVPCCPPCNLMKSNLDEGVFLARAIAIVERLRTRLGAECQT